MKILQKVVGPIGLDRREETHGGVIVTLTGNHTLQFELIIYAALCQVY